MSSGFIITRANLPRALGKHHPKEELKVELNRQNHGGKIMVAK
jgi:hypothetical protein